MIWVLLLAALGASALVLLFVTIIAIGILTDSYMEQEEKTDT